MPEDTPELVRHFRQAFHDDPAAAYREWFRLQEDLRERDDPAVANALAEDLWSILAELSFPSEESRARFFHNVAVFFGTSGPAANLARARQAFEVALQHFSEHDESGWHARVLHNFATALSNLGETAEDFAESVSLFDRALEWRTEEREIARGVTLHNLGIALRRLAALDRSSRREHLERSAACLTEASEIRGRHGLTEARALSLFHRAMTFESLGETETAVESFNRAAEAFERQGKVDSAAVARERAAALSGPGRA